MNFSQKARKGRISLGIFLPCGLASVGGVLSPESVIVIQSLCAECISTLVCGQIYVNMHSPKPTHAEVLLATSITVVVGLGCCYS